MLVDNKVDIGDFQDEVVVDASDAIEIADEIEVEEIGIEPIEIEGEDLGGDFEYISAEPEVIPSQVEFEEVPPVGHTGDSSGEESRLISMVPEDEPPSGRRGLF